MYFVSKYADHSIPVQTDIKHRRLDARGVPFEETLDELVMADFAAARPIPFEFRKFALEHFAGQHGTSRWTHPGMAGLGAQEPGVSPGGQVYQADDPLKKLGVLNTSDPKQVKPQYKAMVEAKLLASRRCGVDYINFDTTLPLPWPAYKNLMATAADIKKMIERIEDDAAAEPSISAVARAKYALQFELENPNPKTGVRVTFTKALETYIEEHEEA